VRLILPNREYSVKQMTSHNINVNTWLTSTQSLEEDPLQVPLMPAQTTTTTLRRRRRPYAAMVSNFSTSYNVVNISLVLPILDVLRGIESSSDAVAAVASSLLLGMMVGQVLGGVLGDVVGPDRALRVVMGLQVVASLSSACVSSSSAYLALAAWRLILGVGAGGVYPLAAVLSAQDDDESSFTPTRASPYRKDEKLQRIVLTFSMQGIGFWTVPAVGVVLLHTCQPELAWRVLLGLGCVPGCILMYWQWWYRPKSHHVVNSVPHMESTEERQDDQHLPAERSLASDDCVVDILTQAQEQVLEEEDQQHQPASDESDLNSDGEIGPILDSNADDIDGLFRDDYDPPQHLSWLRSIRREPDLCRKLMGTAATWFLFDILFYGNTLFQPIVLEAAFGATDHSDNDKDSIRLLQKTALDSLLLATMALPGYVVAGLLMGRTTCGIQQTPRYVMLQGFAAMGLLYLIIGRFWQDLRQFPLALVTLYGLTFFFANYGPNTTTFVLPSLVYSSPCRSTLNGLSAAVGKLGAWTGATLFAPAAKQFGDASVMLICASVAVLAFLLTYAFVRVPEPAGSLLIVPLDGHDDYRPRPVIVVD
jgi:MFS transporter, PHS family, inorganic phosphate transporter